MMPAFRRVAATLLMLAVLGSAQATLTVDGVVEEAIANNPEVVASEMKWRAARAAVGQRGWLPDPKVEVRFEQIPEGEYSLDAANMRMLMASQMVPFPSKLFVRADMAREAALVAKSGYEMTLLKVVTAAKTAYFDFYLVHRTIAIKREERDLVLNYEKVAESGYALGQRPQHDVLRAQVDLAFLADEILALENDELPEAEARLNAVMNRPVHAPLERPEEFVVPELVLSRDELERLTIDNQPALRSAEHEVEKSAAALALVAWDYAPDLMLGVMQQEMRATSMTSYGVMLGVNVPLWFWTKNSGISEKRAAKRSAEAMLQATRNRVLVDLEASFAMVNTAGRRARLFETTIVPLAEQALMSASMAYETGAVDFLTLMNASRKLVDANLGFARMRVKHGKGMAMLEMRVGTDLTKGAE